MKLLHLRGFSPTLALSAFASMLSGSDAVKVASLSRHRYRLAIPYEAASFEGLQP